MQRVIAGLLVALLILAVAIVVQLDQVSKRLDAREQARLDILEARVIVLEKNVERLKATNELKENANERSGLQTDPR